MVTSVIQSIAAFLIPVIIALLITPYMIKLAYSLHAVDKPNERKVHQKATPYLGGAVLFISFLFSLLVFYLIFPHLFIDTNEHIFQLGLLAIGITLVFILGVWDDIKTLSPGFKFVIQFIAAGIVYFAGFEISTVINPVTPFLVDVEFINFPLTILWIIGVTNAINLIDGLDGLASGIATIACVTIFIVSFQYLELWNGLIALMLAGSLVGFLRYNFNPAKIFLGDSGSLLLGFALAILSIHSSTKITTGFSILFPIIVLGLPITDTILSMLRRLLYYYIPSSEKAEEKSLVSKLYSMFVPDKSHIHHQLLAQGFTHRNTVILLYIVSAIFAIGAFTLTWMNSFKDTIILFIIAGIAFFWGIRQLKYREIDIFRNGIFLPLYEKFLINKVIFQSLLDLGFITLSFGASFFVVNWMDPNYLQTSKFQFILVLACIIQLSLFWGTGLYKENIRLVGLGDVLKVLKSVAYAVIAFGSIFPLVIDSFGLPHLLFLVLDFYFLLTFVLGIRFSYHVLKYLFKSTTKAENNILIHGVNESGLMLLHRILNNEDYKDKPIGFLDEDPELEGTYVNGYPVYGGHWKLPRLLQTKSFDRILISAKQQIKPVIRERLKTFSKRHNIEVKRCEFTMQEFSIEASE